VDLHKTRWKTGIFSFKMTPVTNLFVFGKTWEGKATKKKIINYPSLMLCGALGINSVALPSSAHKDSDEADSSALETSPA